MMCWIFYFMKYYCKKHGWDLISKLSANFLLVALLSRIRWWPSYRPKPGIFCWIEELLCEMVLLMPVYCGPDRLVYSSECFIDTRIYVFNVYFVPFIYICLISWILQRVLSQALGLTQTLSSFTDCHCY